VSLCIRQVRQVYYLLTATRGPSYTAPNEPRPIRWPSSKPCTCSLPAFRRHRRSCVSAVPMLPRSSCSGAVPETREPGLLGSESWLLWLAAPLLDIVATGAASGCARARVHRFGAQRGAARRRRGAHEQRAVLWRHCSAALNMHATALPHRPLLLRPWLCRCRALRSSARMAKQAIVCSDITPKSALPPARTCTPRVEAHRGLPDPRLGVRNPPPAQAP